MSEPQNIVPNGSSADASTDLKNTYERVKSSVGAGEYSQQQQPLQYPSQSIDGSVRPQLFRIDSRANLGIRPGLTNPPIRPQQPLQPPPGGVQFSQRPLLQQRPPIPGQIPYRPTPPLNGAPITRPQINPLYRAQNFQRPQAPGTRPQGIFQQRSLPAPATPRPLFNANIISRSQTLDSTESSLLQRIDKDDTTGQTSNNKNENEKPNLTRNSSVEDNPENQKSPIEDRRKSVSIDEDKRTYSNESDEINIRPESRVENYMQKIYENELETNANGNVKSAHENVVEIKANLISTPSLPESSISLSPELKSSNISSAQSKTIISSSSQPKIEMCSTPEPRAASQLSMSNSASRTPQIQKDKEITSKSPILNKDKNIEAQKSGRKSPETKASKLKLFKTEGDNDSGVDESTQGNDRLSNGDRGSPKKSTKSSTPRSATTPTKNKSFTKGSKSPHPKSPDTPTPTSAEKKKVPMNKIQVGSAPSPNLKVVKSKIGSLENAAHKPGGGNVKIENRKIDFSTASSRVTAKNDTYAPGGGEKKIQQQKLTWNVKPKVGSLENANHKPKGGDKKIEMMKLEYKDKAKPKVGSKDNIKHIPGGGDVKIESKKLEIKVQSKVGSMDNIKHKPGGGDKKIYDDKDYLRQTSAHSNASLDGSQISILLRVEKKQFLSNIGYKLLRSTEAVALECIVFVVVSLSIVMPKCDPSDASTIEGGVIALQVKIPPRYLFPALREVAVMIPNSRGEVLQLFPLVSWVPLGFLRSKQLGNVKEGL
ncbi:hypothetical protein FQA39_LY09756 [Lamprigera yunnana]|nr:hypothetical protein FQA39_LY09756 [Lamprigera yunnana]